MAASTSQTTVVEGKLSIYSIESFDKYGHIVEGGLEYRVLTSDGTRYFLKGVNAGAIPIGAGTVRVSGRLSGGNSLDITGGSIVVLGREESDWTPEFNLGEQKTLVLLYAWDDLPLQVSKAHIQELLFGQYPSLADFYFKNSGGKTWFDGDVIGPVTLGAHFDCLNQPSLSDVVVAADNLVDFTQYKRIIFSREFVPECDSRQGGSELPWHQIMKETPDGEVMQTWSSTNWLPPEQGGTDANHLFIAIHEMGHNFGATHSNFLSCSGYFGDSQDAGCNNVEYGNVYSVMGAGVRHFTSNFKNVLGWFDSSNVVSAVSGTYAIKPVENTQGLRQILIPYGLISDFNGDDPNFQYGDVLANYSLEYRQPLEYDGDNNLNLPHSGNFGVFIGLSSRSANNAYPWSNEHMVDAHPNPEILCQNTVYCPAVFDAVLLAGDGFHDNNIRESVNVLSTSPSGAQVHLVQDPVGCVRRFATVSKNFEQPAAPHTPGTLVSYVVGVRNEDSVACGSSVFHIANSAPAGWYVSPASTSFTFLPGQSIEFTVSVRSPNVLPPGENGFQVSVKNNQHFRFNTTLNVTYALVYPTPTPVPSPGGSSGGSPLMVRVVKPAVIGGSGFVSLNELDELDAQASQLQAIDSPAAVLAKEKLAQARRLLASAPSEAKKLASQANSVLVRTKAAKADADGKVVVALIAGVLLVAAWFNHSKFKQKQRPHRRSYYKTR